MDGCARVCGEGRGGRDEGEERPEHTPHRAQVRSKGVVVFVQCTICCIMCKSLHANGQVSNRRMVVDSRRRKDG